MPVVYAAENDEDDDETERDENRPIDSLQTPRHRAAPRNCSRLGARRTRIAPRLTAPSRIRPWINGCMSGWMSKTKSRSLTVRKTNAPKIEPIAPPAPPISDVPPITTAAMELSVYVPPPETLASLDSVIAVRRMPPKAASKPASTYAVNRDRRTAMPVIYAAISDEPIA